MGRVKKFQDKGVIVTPCRDYTLECVKKFADETFDFIYVDARHDYKGVTEDMVAWYPKLKRGGIFAGHDYMTQDEVETAQRKLGRGKVGEQPLSDWTKNYDGTVDETKQVVRGAVNDFANAIGVQVTVAYREWAWNSWAFRKP